MLDLNELQRLCDEAWPPPWEKFGNTVSLKLKGGIVHSITLPGDHQTLAFIAASRAAIPELIARLTAAERERDELREALKHYGAHQSPCPLRYNMSMHGCRCGLWQVQNGSATPTEEQQPSQP